MINYLLTNNEELNLLKDALQQKCLLTNNGNPLQFFSFHHFYNDYLNRTLRIIPSNSEYSDIYSYTFYNQSCLQEVNLTACSNIGNNAFENCTSLKQIKVDNQSQAYGTLATKIGAQAFANCINLENVYFYTYGNIQGWNIFSGCYNLKNLYLYTEPWVLNSLSIFSNSSLDIDYINTHNISHGTIYVLPEHYNNYLTSTNWCLFGNAGYISIMEV